MYKNIAGVLLGILLGGIEAPAAAAAAAVAPPVPAMAYSSETVAVGGSAVLTFTLRNPTANAVALTGVNFFDAIPAGMLLPTPIEKATVCGGTLLIGPGDISLSGATIDVDSACVFSVSVTGRILGGWPNVSGQVQSANGGVGDVAVAFISVVDGAIPTLDPRALALLTLLLLGAGAAALRARRDTR